MLNINFKQQHLVYTLQNKALKMPNQLAYLFLGDGKHETTRITYAELDKKARAIASYLQAKKLFAQRVLLVYPSGIDFVAAFMGCLYAGVIAVPVSVRELEKSPAAIDAIARDADIVGILTTELYKTSLVKCCAELIHATQLFITDIAQFDLDAAVIYQLPKIREDTIAYLQYTSGSTSAPKAVVIQHKTLMHNIVYSAKAWRYSKKSITLTWAPNSHVYGLVCGLLVPLYCGTTAILIPTDIFVRRPLNWLEAISKYRVTHSGSPNFGYDLCVREINPADIKNLNLKSWKVAVNGGELIQHDTLIKFSEKFSSCGFKLKHFNPAYGMSEVAGAIALSEYAENPVVFDLTREGLQNHSIIIKKFPWVSARQHFAKSAVANVADKSSLSRKFIGGLQVLSGLTVVAVDPDTKKPVAKGKIGEIWLTGKAVAHGYWRRPQETKELFHAKLPNSNQSYFRTGDLGFVKDGKICLTGRIKEIINIRGKKYYPLDLEMTITDNLKSFPISHAHAAFSLLVEGEETVVFVQELKGEINDNAQNEIIQTIRHLILKYYGIDLHDVILVHENSLPKTPSGKLQRKLCKELYVEGKLDIVNQNLKKSISVRPSIPVVVEDQIEQPVLEASASLNSEVTKPDFVSLVASILSLNANQIDLDAPISKYGFDSIKVTQLTTRLNENYQLALTPAMLFEYTTLIDFFNDLLLRKEISFNQSTMPVVQIEKEKIATQINDKDIAIIGISGLFPGAADADTFWDNLIHGKNAISEIPKDRWSWEDYYGDPLVDGNKTQVKWGGFVDEIAQFDAAFFNISPREAELIDPQQRVFLQTAWKAIEDAGYTTKTLTQLKVGLFVGVFNHDYAELLQKSGITDAYITTGTTHSILANRVSYLLNLNGPSEAIDTACSSSLVAIHNAVKAINNGDCAVAIAGGVNALLSPTPYLTASKAGMLSAEGQCKTFDKNANGYVRAEGAGAIVLKSLRDALAAGDPIYGVIKGTAVNHGGHVSSLTVPNPNAQADVIAEACQRAHVSIESITFIETHGTGTSLGDPVEINGLKKAFNILAENKERVAHPYCGLGAVKTHIGHLEAAAGIAGVIKILLAMKHKQIPGNLNFAELNPYIQLENSPFYIADKTTEWSQLKDNAGNRLPRRAGISSFGFGGTNAHIVIEEFPHAETTEPTASYPFLVALSAKTEIALQQRIKDLFAWLNKQTSLPSLAELSYTLNAGREHFNKRCIFIVESVAELQKTLRDVVADQQPENFIISTETISREKARPVFEELFNQLQKELSATNTVSVNEYRKKLLAIGHFYTEGYELDWNMFYPNEIKRISLPTYPFAKNHYWIPAATIASPQSKPVETGVSLLSRVQSDFIQHVSLLLKIEPSTVKLTSSLSDVGFDSISFKELAVHLENYYDIEFNPSLFFTYNTIQSLSEYLINTHVEQIARSYQAATVVTPVVDKKSFYSKREEKKGFEPIAIVGMQGLFPQSKDLHEFWEQLQEGCDLVTEIPKDRWDWRQYYGDIKESQTKTNSRWGGFIADVDKFDAAFFNISAREANLMDPQQRLFLEVVWKTIEDAGYDPFSLAGQEVGLFAGVEFNEYQTLIHISQKIFHGHVATGNSHALLANRISYFFDFHGPSEVIDTACSSALVAIHRAVSALQNHECTVAIAGGVSLMLNPDTFVITSQLGALSADGRCKTFDKTANGYVKGEGVAAILLKPLHRAQREGDHIYGVIRGSVVNHGGKAQSLTAPNAAAQSQLLAKAYSQAQVDPKTVTYIETHGTGTELGDPIEIEGLKQAFYELTAEKEHKKAYCGLGSVKSNIGHLEPASGIAGVIKVLLAMQHEKIPGNLHLKELNSYIELENSPFYIIDKTQAWTRLKTKEGDDIPFRAGVSSFGFGGTNAHIILEEAPTKHFQTDTQNQLKPYYLVTLSAKNAERLQQKIIDLYEWLKQHFSTVNLERLSFTLNIGRAHFDARCALVVSSLDELLNSLQTLVNRQRPDNCIFNEEKISHIESPAFSERYKSAINTLNHFASLKPHVYREKLLVLADLYTKNYPIDWQIVHEGEIKQRVVGLPAYPFAKQRYWFDAEFKEAAAPTTNIVVETKADAKLDLKDFAVKYLQTVFAEKLTLSPQQIASDTTYEVYGVDSLLGIEITNRLEKDFGTLSKTLLYERNCINDLADYFQKKYNNVLQKLANPNAEVIAVAQEQISSVVAENQAKELTSFDVAIIGVTGTYPLANTLDEFWENLTQGRDCITEVPTERWDYKEYPVTIGDEKKYFNKGGFIPDIDKFDPLFFSIAPRDAALMDPQERLFMQSAWTTLEDAGYTRKSLQAINNHVGVFAGVTYNFYPLFVAEEWAKGNRLPLDIQQFSVANRVSYFLNLNGPSYTVDTACSSSLAAIHLAYESIVRGECIMAIAGGVNLSLHPSKYHFLGSYGFLSEHGRCASFAEGGAGYVPGEGVGTILLKSLELAVKEGDRIYGVIKSSSMNHGGKTSGYTVPSPVAQAALVKNALAKANIDPRTISYVEAHGTGTSLGDPIEIKGLQEAFEEYTQDKQFCAIGSVKSNIGHLESAAGVSQLTKVLLQMQHKKLVPSLHAEKLNPFIDFQRTPFFVQRELSDWQTAHSQSRRAGISSFGAGGTNVHVIVEEFIAKAAKQDSVPLQKGNDGKFLFLLSAFNEERLHDYAQQVHTFLIAEKKKHASLEAWLTDLCYTSQVGRQAMSARLAVLATSYQDLVEKLYRYVTRATEPLNQVWVNPTGDAKHAENINYAEYTSLAQAWVNGASIAWEELYGEQKPNRIYFPTYPFAKRRCWVPTTVVEKQINAPTPVPHPVPLPPVKDTTIELPDFLNEWLYCTKWEKRSTDLSEKVSRNNDNWLIFSDSELSLKLRDELGEDACTLCYAGQDMQRTEKNVFNINPERAEDYLGLFSRLYAENNANFKGVIYLWTMKDENVEASKKLLYLFQALIKQKWQHKLKFCLVARCSQSVSERDTVNVWQHHLWSMTRIFGAEQGDYQVQLLDLDADNYLVEDAKIIAQEIYQFKPEENHLAYRQGERHVICLTPYLKDFNQSHLEKWVAPEAAIVTGGLGALGLEVAKWLIQQGTKYLLLTGSTVLPDEKKWSTVQDAGLQEKIKNIIALQHKRAIVRYAAVDVSDKTKMQEVVRQVEQAWGRPIQGVFHLAGITTDSITIDKMSAELMQKVFAVKAQGVLVLHEIFNTAATNCFVLFSSIAALPFFGMSGLSAYAMANEFLNGLALLRRSQGLPAMSINWAAWAEKGMSFRYNHGKFLEAVGMSEIPVSQGMDILTQLMNIKPTEATVFKITWQKFLTVNAAAKKMAFFTHFAGSPQESTQQKQMNLSREQIAALITDILAKLLVLEKTEVNPSMPYSDYGLDSIIGINFVSELGEHFPDVVSPMDLYRYPSVNQLVDYIIQTYQAKPAAVIAEKTENTVMDLDKMDANQINQLLEKELSDLDDLMGEDK